MAPTAADAIELPFLGGSASWAARWWKLPASGCGLGCTITIGPLSRRPGLARGWAAKWPAHSRLTSFPQAATYALEMYCEL